MKKKLLTSLVSLHCNLVFAQAPDTMWTKTFGGYAIDMGYSIQQTTDGGYIITGFTESFGAGDYDLWLIKTDSKGDTLWTKTFGGINDDWGNSVQQTTDGGYIITGFTDSFNLHGDVWLIKTDINGDTLWAKTIGRSLRDDGYSVQQTTDGGYIITGETYSLDTGYDDVWLIKTDDSGDTLWTKTFRRNPSNIGYSVQQTTDDGYIITAVVYSGNISYDDVWLIKTDASGDTLWTKTFGGSDFDRGYSVQQTLDGGYILVGATSSFGVGNDDSWLIKTDAIGDTLWAKTFGGNDSDEGKSVRETTDGGYIIVGSTSSFGFGYYSDVWLIKTNASGDTLWTKTFGGIYDDWGYSVQQTTDDGYIITGYTGSYGAGSSDIYLIKTTPDISSIEQNTDILISDFSLQQNFPNPFNPSTKISWQSPAGSWQTLKIYDVLGNEVVTLVDEYKLAGKYEVEFDASSLTSGVYFYQLQAIDPESSSGQAYIKTKKMILLK